MLHLKVVTLMIPQVSLLDQQDLKFQLIVAGVKIRPCTQTLKNNLRMAFNPLTLYVHDID